MLIRIGGITRGLGESNSFNNTSSNIGVTPESLFNFPVLVKLTSSNFDFGKAQSSGQDIRFIDSDNSTELGYEIEKWDATNKLAFIWVKIPQIDASSSDYIYMYYGNPSASDNQNAGAVWDINFKGVWHLKEDPSGIAPQVSDSTSNNNDGTSNGSMTSSDQVVGQIDGGLDFDGTDDYVSIPNDSSIDPLSSLTLEAWVKPASTANDIALIANKGRDIEANKFSMGLLGPSGCGTPGNYLAYFQFNDQDNNPFNIESCRDIAVGEWYHVIGTWNGSETKLYVNGVLKSENTSASFTRQANARDFYIGAHVIVAMYPFHGVIDEVRLSDTSRSAAWVAAVASLLFPLESTQVVTESPSFNPVMASALSHRSKPEIESG